MLTARPPRLALAGIILACTLAVGHIAACDPDVLWLGVQEKDDLSWQGAIALDMAMESRLTAALAPKKVTVQYSTQQTPRARRALDEYGFVRMGARDTLHDTEARALGVALGAAATVRAWVDIEGGTTRFTTFTAAVHRRQLIVHQIEAPAPPAASAPLRDWARGLATAAAAKIAASIADALRDAPATAAQFAAAGERFSTEGLPSIAMLEFNRAIALAPKETKYYVACAQAYEAMGEPERARRQIDVALELSPDSATARVELGRLNLASGQTDAAIRELRRAIDLGAGNDAHMALGDALVRSGNLAAAADEYRAVAEKEPGNSEAARRVAEIAAALASTAGSGEVGAVKPAPSQPVATRQLVNSYVEGGDRAAAISELRLLGEQSGSASYEPREYVKVVRLLDREMDDILVEARGQWDALDRAAVTTQQVEDTIKALHERSDALTRAAAAIVAPPVLERGYRHRVLAYTLLNQSDFDLMRYLERHENSYYDEGVVAREAAVAELKRAWELDADAGWPTRTAAEQ
jgi:tetratricopeptide (TPR) repeat protein